MLAAPGRPLGTMRDDVIVTLLLTGFVSYRDAALALGVGEGELSEMLGELGLTDVAMVPVAVDERAKMTFADLGRDAFSAAVFDDVSEARGGDGIWRFDVRAEDLLDVGPGRCPSPDGLVFHVGRAGSTLVCNLIAGLCGWVAVKEPEVVNALLLRLMATSDPAARAALGQLVGLVLRSFAHGARRDADGRDRRCVVKLTSWNLLLAHEVVSQLDDCVPLVVVVRDPCATVASFLDHPPHWLAASRTEAAELLALTWRRTVERALELPADRTLLVGYDALIRNPALAMEEIRLHLGDERRVAIRVADTMQRYSKGAREERFDAGGIHRRTPLAGDLRELVTALTCDSWSALATRLTERPWATS